MADHIRCPACGKLSRPENFEKGAAEGHELQVAMQWSLSRPGHKGGFEWAARDLTRQERVELAQRLRAVADRLEQEVVSDELLRAPTRDFQRLADVYADAGEVREARAALVDRVRRRRRRAV